MPDTVSSVVMVVALWPLCPYSPSSRLSIPSHNSSTYHSPRALPRHSPKHPSWQFCSLTVLQLKCPPFSPFPRFENEKQNCHPESGINLYSGSGVTDTQTYSPTPSFCSPNCSVLSDLPFLTCKMGGGVVVAPPLVTS